MLFWRKQFLKSGKRVEITLYSKPECHLCDVAKEVLESRQAYVPMEISEIDIRDSEDLTEEYGTEIPVVFVGGQKCFRHRVHPKGLERRLKEEALRMLKGLS
ncbi:MAG: glutaredoxin family protein [Planctomycetota bacterium]|nr:glutaredoxin family protein [Planctomycetota bacterium]MDA1140400.1 glutaredoxin family protein [Planctomycetota bacterium]